MEKQEHALATLTASPFQTVFDRLRGEWRIDRRIVSPLSDGDDDHIGQIAGRLTGVAYFEPVEDGVLAYREEGRLRLRGGAAVKAVRQYRYRLDDDALLIEFADGPDAGQRFLRLETADETADASVDMLADEPVERAEGRAKPGEQAERVDTRWHVADNHLCGRDLYQALYRFDGFDQPVRADEKIVQRTVVNGPRKDYAIVTVLRRVASA